MRRYPIVLAFILLCASAASAQIPHITEQTQTPSPGTGHDYIKGLNETVNPSNGSLTINLSVPVPSGRQVTVPFSIVYNSGQAVTGPYVPATTYGFYPNTISDVSAHGWSYTIPTITYMPGSYNDPEYGECGFTTDFVYYDAKGGASTMGVGDAEESPACIYNGISSSDPAQDGTILGGGTEVTDADGTSYYMGNNSGGGYGGTAIGASQIEDRNGNLINITRSGTGAYTYTDTMGRNILSTSGFGSGTTTVTSTKFSAPYTLAWETVSYDYTMTVEDDASSPGAYNCGTGIHYGTQNASGSLSVVQSITLPNGQAYTFGYDPSYGRVNRINYPSGAYVRYVWGMRSLSINFFLTGFLNDGSNYGCQLFYDEPVITDRYVSPDGVTETEHQNFSYSAQPVATSQTAMVDTDQVTGQTRQTNYGYVAGAPSWVPFDTNGYGNPPFNESTIMYSSGSSGLETVNKTWLNGDSRELASQQTTLDNGSTTSETDYCYNTFYEVVEKDEFNYSGTGSPSSTCNGTTAPGPLLRKTVTSYYSAGSWGPNEAYWNGWWIIDRPASVITYDGPTGTRMAETDYSYGDATSPVTATSHDDTYYGSGSTWSRGNLISVTKQCLQSCASATTTYAYDDTGQVISMTDPDSHPPTTYSYNDCFSSGSASGATDGYLTQIVDALGHTDSFCYGYDDGTLMSSTDVNNQTTSYTYSDSLDRLTSVSYPDGGSTQYSYRDSAPMSTTETQAMGSAGNLVNITMYDGLARPTQTELASDPDGATFTATQYDGFGRKHVVYNPTRCAPATNNCGESTWGYTTYAYDGLNRPVTVTEQDGSVVSTSYPDPCKIVTDESSKVRESCSDAAGRLTSVTEDPSGLNYLTSYTYDALNNLTAVTQSGSRSRSFTYDSLSRLMSATNPESGTTRYTYDADDNVATRTDARSITTTYTYDALDRLTYKSYSDGTPSATYNYDETNWVGVWIFNGIGRLTSQGVFDGTNWLASSGFSYDAMGRIVNNAQWQLDGNTMYPMLYSYDLIGDMLTYSYPAGIAFNQTFNLAGRPTQLTNTWTSYDNPATLATGVHYNAAGAPNVATLGNGVTVTKAYDGRLQPCRMNANSAGAVLGSCTDALPSGNVLDLSYGFNYGSGDNGDVMSMAATGAQTINRSYSYDALNRLAAMSAPGDTCSGLSWTYDAWGNRTQQTATGGTCNTFSQSVNGNNQLAGSYQYDAAGNMTYDGVHHYTYDAESRLTQVDGGATATYVYGADGRRANKTVGGVETDYFYDLAGRVIADYQCGGTCWHVGYVYFNGETIAGFWGPTYFFVTDQLGSTRLLTNYSDPSIIECDDYYPYGEHIGCGSTGTTTHLFTGKEHDAESGLDNFGARYDSSALGRFMTPDWSKNPEAVPYADYDDPQSLNLYSYVRDNPLLGPDLDGHQSQCQPTQTGRTPEGDAVIQNNCQQGQQQAQDPQQAKKTDEQKKDDQQYHQALQERKQQFLAKQAGPAPGSPEYVKATLGEAGKQATQEVKALAPAVGGPAVATAAVVMAAPIVAAGVDTTQAAVAMNPVASVQFAEGFVSGVSPGVSGFPPTAAGAAGYAIGEGVNYIINKLDPGP